MTSTLLAGSQARAGRLDLLTRLRSEIAPRRSPRRGRRAGRYRETVVTTANRDDHDGQRDEHSTT